MKAQNNWSKPGEAVKHVIGHLKTTVNMRKTRHIFNRVGYLQYDDALTDDEAKWSF